MPILKQLVSNSSQSKRRSRVDLTADMISAPLGDFRHTMHVGRGGDAFGDTSFLSTRSGEPPQQEAHPQSSGSRPSLLSRTFRHSKRSQSVTRVDKRESTLALPSTSPSFVKNAVSLPHLNDDNEAPQRASIISVPKSLSSSPLKMIANERPVNGAAASLQGEPEHFDERDFGELSDLPTTSLPKTGGGLKHAESIMSFHVDLGPSMLGDILSIMDKKGWEEDDLGFEEDGTLMGKVSLPPASQQNVAASILLPKEDPAPYTPETKPRHPRHPVDSCSVSSSGSAVLEDKQPLEKETPSHVNVSHSRKEEEDQGFSFMDEDDDEIRV
ncbi:cdc42 effector protein 4-like [Polypterus senegalus]